MPAYIRVTAFSTLLKVILSLLSGIYHPVHSSFHCKTTGVSLRTFELILANLILSGRPRELRCEGFLLPTLSRAATIQQDFLLLVAGA